MKELLSKKRKFMEHEVVMVNEECSAIIHQKLPQKLKDPRSFTIHCAIGGKDFGKPLCDLGASINLMSLSIVRNLRLGQLKGTIISLQLADMFVVYPLGLVEDILVKVDKFIFPIDFEVLDMESDREMPLLLGRPLLATGSTLIDVKEGKITLRVGDCNKPPQAVRTQG
ncbi:hypothetical protein LIER_30685 [Lithospermum erythrorhizon]|uniref:Aspartic peptidase DDI1-type domain-containing protein n=1 Tax=Lithospermum erythrorhizon TaxID=34254 RepID=A0AAV3RNI3_LITER